MADLNAKIQEIVDLMESDRKAGDYEAADFLRRELSKIGVIVQNTPNGTIWRRAL